MNNGNRDMKEIGSWLPYYPFGQICFTALRIIMSEKRNCLDNLNISEICSAFIWKIFTLGISKIICPDHTVFFSSVPLSVCNIL